MTRFLKCEESEDMKNEDMYKNVESEDTIFSTEE